MEKIINKLHHHILKLEALNKRFSWYRLAAILIGSLITWFAFIHITSSWGWIVFLSSLSIFAIIVYYHNQLDKTIQKFRILKGIKESNVARKQLDWVNIPNTSITDYISGLNIDVDLDLLGPQSLHQLLDTSISVEGSNLLVQWLTQTEPNPIEILERQAIIRELARLTRFRERLLLHFRLISPNILNGGKLLKWLEEKHPPSLGKNQLLIAVILTSCNILLFTAFSFNLLPAFWWFSLSFYMVFYLYNLNKINKTLYPFAQMETELDKFRSVLKFLETYPLIDSPNLIKLCEPYQKEPQRPSHQLRQIKLISAAVGLRMNPIFGFLINLILPWDFLLIHIIDKKRKSLTDLLPSWVDTFSKFEALSSLANFSALNPDYRFPTISPESNPIFQAQNLGHPLIKPENKICNNFTVTRMGSIAIITGSNMAGKSTFIKTIGINFCLAYAGGPVNAQTFTAIPLRLHTCIRIQDSLIEGYSYFYAEVKCLKQLLNNLQERMNFPTLYLVDEIFRGTNNRERLIGSRSYIKTIQGKRGVGFLATHDLELATLAENNTYITNYHFRDSVQAGQLVFDYIIHAGPSPTTNALKIMELEGLPIDT